MPQRQYRGPLPWVRTKPGSIALTGSVGDAIFQSYAVRPRLFVARSRFSASRCSFSDPRQSLDPVKMQIPRLPRAPPPMRHTIDSQGVEPTIVLSRSRSLWLSHCPLRGPPSQPLSARPRWRAPLVGRCQCGLHCGLGCFGSTAYLGGLVSLDAGWRMAMAHSC